MKTKTILSIAIMAALPFAAHADPVGPAAVPANGTAVVATANAPYVTQTPTAADATHIASTAYVKGAYNDAIAAVNKVANTVDGKQAQLVNLTTNHEIYSKVFNDESAGIIGESLVLIDNNEEFSNLMMDITGDVTNGESLDAGDILMTAGTTMRMIRGAAQRLKDDAKGEIQEQRVEIYTTWENDNAKQQVAFVTAQ